MNKLYWTVSMFVHYEVKHVVSVIVLNEKNLLIFIEKSNIPYKHFNTFVK